MEFMNMDQVINEKVQQQILQVNKDIAYLRELVNDPKKYGELIKVLDPTVDRLDNCVVELQAVLTKELSKKTKEFEVTIKSLDDSVVFFASQPPSLLSDANKTKWHKFAASKVSKQQLTDFKQALIDAFKSEMYKKLQIEELAEKNITIRRLLAQIRRTLLI